MPNNTPPEWASSRFDTSVPHSARIWNYWLGGKDNYAADRQAGDAYAAIFPRITQIARSSRYFLARAVRYLAADAGIRQFLDIAAEIDARTSTKGGTGAIARQWAIAGVRVRERLAGRGHAHLERGRPASAAADLTD